MIILGVLLLLLFICSITVINDVSLSSYIEVNGLIIILGSIIAILLSTGFFKAFVNGLKVLFIKDFALTEDEKKDCITIYSLLVKTTLIGGILGVLVGILIILAKLGGQERIGPPIGLSILSLFYGLICSYFIFLPAKIRIEKSRVK